MNIVYLIIHYNNTAALKNTLKNFIDFGVRAADIVVLDNGSDHDSRKRLQLISNMEKIEVVYEDENIGWGAAINKFLDSNIRKYGKILAISAHDSIFVRFDPKVIEKEFSNEGVVVVSPDYPEPQRCAYSVPQGFRCFRQKEACRQEVIIGHATLCFVDSERIKSVRYDENFFIYGCESEIFLRIHDAGYRSIITNEIIVENPVTDTDSEFRELIFSINSIYCAKIRGGFVGYLIRMMVVFLSLLNMKRLRDPRLLLARINALKFSLRSGGAGFKEWRRERHE